MKFYGKFKTNIQRGDYITFDVHSDNMFRVLNISHDGMHILVMENKRAIWKFINDIVSVWGVSYE